MAASSPMRTKFKQMKNTIILLLLTLGMGNLYAQTTQTRDNAGLQGDAGATSGFFQTNNPTNYPTNNTSEWWHLLDVRHTNPTNNYAMQFAAKFYEQGLWYRSTADNASQPWSKVLLETNGNAGIGTANPLAPIHILGGAAMTSGWNRTSILEATYPVQLFNSSNIKYGGIGYDHSSAMYFWVNAPNNDISSIYPAMGILNNGNVGIGIANPLHILHVKNQSPTMNFEKTGILNWTIGNIADNDFYIQADNAPSSPFMIESGSGNVGVGTATPQTKLDVNGIVQVYNKDNQTANWDNMRLWADGTNGIIESNGDENGMVIRSNGGNKILLMSNVGIGTTTPNEKLSVNGKIRAKEIKVEATGWPDYVFENGYQTQSLTELEQFIKQYKHLPEVPSAKEVEQNGVELGEINKILLKKIEELTLLLIEQNKRIEQLEQKK